MRQLFHISILICLFFSCNSEKQVEKQSEDVKTYKESLGWGYDIYINGKLAIHQPIIPAVPGNQGFQTEGEARKTGELMLHKIQHNIMPPSIDVRELDSLEIKYKK